MLGHYWQGYSLSLDWEVTTTADVIAFPAWKYDSGLMIHEIKGEKYLLQERYSGSEIERNLPLEVIQLTLLWLGVCILLAASTRFHKYLFFATIAALALLINRLNLYEIGLFGISSKLVMLLPFLLLAIPLIYFHEYNKKIKFPVRIAVLIGCSAIPLFGVSDSITFIDHFAAHSLFPMAICALLFLFLISEEIVFTILRVITSVKGGRSNHLHFFILSLIYLGNLILYYLNKSGLFENAFFLFDPIVLLVVSSLVALWSIQFKGDRFANYLPPAYLKIVLAGLGVVSFSFLMFAIGRGMDGVYQFYHYFILYTHIGFGVMFFLYVLSNFLDPLIKGFEVHKIVYRERNLPYATAKLGGLVIICAFYFLAGQEPYNLLRSGYFNYLSVIEDGKKNALLSKEYLIQAGFLGYNTHYPNYVLAWKEWNTGNEFRAKSNFFNAAQRFPSDYALVNYGNIDAEVNPNKVQAIYEEALRKSSSAEMENNLGILHLDKGEVEKALGYFEKTKPDASWNQAPRINKWHVYKKIETIDSTSLLSDYEDGNYGAKANILSTLSDTAVLSFDFSGLAQSPPLHRQAYLLNSSYLFSHDSISSFLRWEIDLTSDGSTASRLSKALALHLYEKGEVNEAFLILDNLQANAHQFYKGEYLDILGKLALQQGAFRLALDFFNQALNAKYEPSRWSRLEALAGLDMNESITNELLKLLKKDPDRTNYSNQLLQKLESFNPSSKRTAVPNLEAMSDSAIFKEAKKNAFHDQLIVAAVSELSERGSDKTYDLLIEAIEINPYSVPLIKQYILTALDWNLIDYAKQSLEKLAELMDDEEYNAFKELFEQKRAEQSSDQW
ncbi:MAG: hypothetical protein Tsb0034_15180 [Ekhidna sp.]